MQNDLEQLIGANERILYMGKPNLKCSIFESVFNRMLWFALLWGFLDIGVFNDFFKGGFSGEMFFYVPFFLLHMMPVWLYLFGVLSCYKRYQNTKYIITSFAIYVSGGVFAKTYNTKSFAEMSNVNMHRGAFDQAFDVGDVIVTSNQFSGNSVDLIAIENISEYMEVYNMVKTLQNNLYTEVIYPNDLRSN